MSEKQLLIGRLAKLSGVKSDTIRFYERSGLLPKPSRTASGYRVYGEAAVRQVRFIKRAQALGFALAEIRRVLHLRGGGDETCRCVIAMADATLDETEKKLKEMQRFADALRANLTRWRKMSDHGKHVVGEFCRLIESSSTADAK